MIGVRFTRAMAPWGAGDVALLPDAVAERVVDAGEAELADLPDAPFAHEAKGPAPAPVAPVPASAQAGVLLPLGEDDDGDPAGKPRRRAKGTYLTKES